MLYAIYDWLFYYKVDEIESIYIYIYILADINDRLLIIPSSNVTEQYKC